MQDSRTKDAPLLVGRYRVIERIGSGGMASVMLAEDERLGRLVAVKRLPSSSPEDALARFRREARLGASLNHANVVSIYDSCTDDDALLIVMEYVDGESLKERLRQGPLPPREALPILAQIAAALDHAHAAGVIHRDVKPSNVLIAHDGTAKLADLGIATAADSTSITSGEDIIGTLSYIAPERLESTEDDPAADVYSLAAVAYEALSGLRAQQGRTPSEIVAAPSPRDLREVWPQAPAGAAKALREGLAREPGRRPRSATEFVNRLTTGLGGAEVAFPVETEATNVMPRRGAAVSAGGAGRRASADGAASGWWSPRRRAFAAILAGLAGVAVAIALIGGGGDGQKAARVKTRTETVTQKTKPKPPPAPLTGAALGGELNDQGKALIDSGQYEQAIPLLQRAVDAFPSGATDINYAYALYNLGNALRLAGRPQEAIPLLEQRLQIPNQQGAVAQELELAQQQAGETSSGGVQPSAPSGDSGGVKPGKGREGDKD